MSEKKEIKQGSILNFVSMEKRAKTTESTDKKEINLEKARELANEEKKKECMIETKEAKIPDMIGNFAPYQSWMDDLGDWKTPLEDFLKTDQLQKVYEFVAKEYNAGPIFPPQELIFNAFKTTSFANLKVVIVGQDPYIKPKEAMGLSFSVPKGVRVPGSLINIYKALEADPEISFVRPKPPHGEIYD